MEPLSGAASVIAVVQLTAAIVKICGIYTSKVKDAKQDIYDLQQEIKGLIGVLESFDELLQGPNGTKLIASQKFSENLRKCFSILLSLKNRIDPEKTQKPMRRWGIRAFKWPLKRTDVDNFIREIERYKVSLNLALQIDQTRNTDYIDHKISLQGLKTAKGAAFDSYENQHDDCLQGTREDILRQIEKWVRSPDEKCIFWLNGGAGTGKSTIARTIARRLKESNNMLLGASFFFKRGEENRGNAKRLFSTLVQQLIIHIPELGPGVKKIIDSDPYISDKALGEQFNKLLLQPLLEIETGQPKVAVVVIDALDECQSERQDEDIRTILQLLPRARESKLMQLRFFLTSRPELPLRLGFKKIMEHYRDMDLYDIPESEIKRDISLFLEHNFSKIREEHEISSDWPKKEAMQTLVTKTVPLFISATTLCRFIGDANWNPQQRLDIILKDRTEYVSRMSSIYLPVLNQFLSGQNERECNQLVQEFKQIVGAIILLTMPLSIHALSQLLEIATADIKKRLGRLHSVLDIPEKIDSPVRILHLSFRDFLLDSNTKNAGESEKFWVDEKIMHQNLTDRCINIMHNRLKRNICNIPSDGKQRHDIDMDTINSYLPSELQYACQHWVHHLTKSQDPVTQLIGAHSFLNEHFLHWVEAMSILGMISEVVRLINILQLIIQNNKNSDILEFLYDAKQFVLRNRQIADTAPLQLYSSGLAFAPRTSKVRNIFEKDKSNWLYQLPEVEEYWGAEVLALEDHSDSIHSVAFSLDGQLLASGSSDKTIKLWDPITGELYQTLEGHSHSVTSVAFSNNRLASGSKDGTIKLWDPIAGKLCLTLEGHCDYVNSVAFSSNQLASGSQDGTIKLWDPITGKLHHTLEDHTCFPVDCVAFSNTQLASGHVGGTVRLWDPITGELSQTLEDDSFVWVRSITLSPNNQLLACGSINGTIKLWDLTVNKLHQTLEGHPGSVESLVFSPDNLLVSGAIDGMIKFWNPITGELYETLQHSTMGELQEKYRDSSMVESIAFSADGQLLASGSSDRVIKLWDPTINKPNRFLEDHASSVESMAFSRDGQSLASGSRNTIKIWDPIMGKSYQTLEDNFGLSPSLVFSSDNQVLISGSTDHTIKFWDLITGKLQQSLKDHGGSVISLAFSSDNPFLASGSTDNTIKLWNPVTGKLYQTLQASSPISLTFSSNGQLLASCSRDNTTNIWDPVTGKLYQTIQNDSRGISTVTFSPDDQLLAFSCNDGATTLWNPITGELHRTLEGHSHWIWLGDNDGISLLKDQWICYQDEKKLWLPVEYRPSCMAIKDDILILGLKSGRVLFIPCSLN